VIEHARNLAWDLRLALRGLGRTPLFAGAAIAIIALGTGANTAIFSAVEAVLLRPIPAADTRGLIAVQTDLVGSSLHDGRLAPEVVYDLSDRRDVFSAVGGYRAAFVTLTGSGEPHRVSAVATAGAFFEALAVRPFLGRLYAIDDVEHGDAREVVLNFDFWRREMGADSSIVGKTIRLDDSTYRVVGVLPDGVDYPRGVAIYTPHQLEPGFALDRRAWGSLIITTIARPRIGTTPAQIRAAFDAEMVAVVRRHPEYAATKIRQRLVFRPFVDALAGSLRAILVALLACVAFVLLIACANVASLQLVRTAGRAREIAVRRALGASAAAVVRQLGLENLLIAVSGGVAGIGIAFLAIGMLRRTDASRLATLADARLDGPVLAWSITIAILTAVVFGLGPVVRALRVDPADALRGGARGASMGLDRSRSLRAVVVVQVALALVLLLGCGTAWRSVRQLLSVDPGFRPDGVMTMRLVLPPARYRSELDSSRSGPTVTSFYSALIDRLRAVPGFTAVGAVGGAPFGYVQENEHSMVVHAADRAASKDDPVADVWMIGGDYFRAMGLPLRQGRVPSATDAMCSATSAIVVDETLARRLYPARSAMGQRLNACFGEIVGVVRTSKKADLAAPDHGAIYARYGKYVPNDLTMVVRTPLSLASASRALRQAVSDIDSLVAPGEVRALAQDVDRSVAPQRLASNVLSALAVLATILAALGLFGVLSYGTAQRAREIGIRAAVGATPESLAALVLAGGARLVAIGLTIGAALYLWLAGLTANAVYAVSPRSPVTMVAGVAGITVVALFACYVPARRAAASDPVKSLRAD
jgi:putative ABC transport system permease protein